MRDGFLHLNSDLLFDPAAAALLRAPDDNAVIVDRDVRAGQRHDEGGDGRPSHLQDGETTDHQRRSGGRRAGQVRSRWRGRVVGRLAQLARPAIAAWAYSVFGELAPAVVRRGRQPWCFWAEVDTVADKREAERRIPQPLVTFAARDANASRVADPQSAITSCGRRSRLTLADVTYGRVGRRADFSGKEKNVFSLKRHQLLTLASGDRSYSI